MENIVILSADLSLRRPAFAILSVDTSGLVEVIEVSAIDNKRYVKKEYRKTQPQILSQINNILRTEILQRYSLMSAHSCKMVAVRERGFSRFSTETQAIYRVVGITDMALYEVLKLEWAEIAPLSVKKTITGNGKSTKQEVALSLGKYLTEPIAEFNFEGDDEADAIAVGVAWLINNGYVKEETKEEITEQNGE